MSRSYKKHGIIKDKGLSRGEYNRRLRRVNRQRVKQGKDPKLMLELINQYDVCDYKMYWERGYYYRLIREGLLTELEFETRKRSYFSK